MINKKKIQTDIFKDIQPKQLCKLANTCATFKSLQTETKTAIPSVQKVCYKQKKSPYLTLNTKIEPTMVLEDVTTVQNISMIYPNIGRTVKTALLKADSESRVIVGLNNAIKMLNKQHDGSLFCLMAQPKAGDSATHMNEVLLEAFCYEHDIYVIKVDCATKLSRILGKTIVESCCLIQKPWADKDSENLNKSENILVDFCEAYWDSPTQPIVKLPSV